MLITFETKVTTSREIEFPFYSKNRSTFFYNIAPLESIAVFTATKQICYYDTTNAGLEHEEIKASEFQKAFDETLQFIINKF